MKLDTLIIDTKNYVLQTFVYLFGVYLIFPLFVMTQGGYGHVFIAMENILYWAPTVLPTPIAVLLLLLPVGIWNAWEREERAAMFFYASMLLLITYVGLALGFVLLMPLVFFVLGFGAAVLAKHALSRRIKLPSWVFTVLMYLIVGPLAYWLLIAYI
jgi:hypothetical protein